MAKMLLLKLRRGKTSEIYSINNKFYLLTFNMCIYVKMLMKHNLYRAYVRCSAGKSNKRVSTNTRKSKKFFPLKVVPRAIKKKKKEKSICLSHCMETYFIIICLICSICDRRVFLDFYLE